MLVLGGIWETFSDLSNGEKILTFSIATTQSNDLMSIIHNSKKRMPLIFCPDNGLDWLNNNTDELFIESLIKPFDLLLMKAHTFQKINTTKHENDNDPSFCAYGNYPELNDVHKNELLN